MPDSALTPGVRLGVERLTARYDLRPASAHALGALLELLARDEHAPTTVRQAANALEAHLADSLVALELPEVAEASTIADIGAGAGFPGLALAAARPLATIHAIESVGRKVDFIRAAALAAGLHNVHAHHARAEDLPAGRESVDVVTARALGPLVVLAEYAAPMLAPGGVLVAWKGRRDPAAEDQAAAAAPQLGLEAAEVVHVDPFPGARDRHLHVFRKVAATPERFPRRPGMARKRPLSANSG
jgi:16S rRNA (guanine527-N7)-methyltransferase